MSRTNKFDERIRRYLKETIRRKSGMLATDGRSFGEAVRKRRKELGYTQAFLSEFSGFSVSFISDLERGKDTAELGKALYLANLLGLDVDLKSRG